MKGSSGRRSAREGIKCSERDQLGADRVFLLSELNEYSVDDFETPLNAFDLVVKLVHSCFHIGDIFCIAGLLTS